MNVRGAISKTLTLTIWNSPWANDMLERSKIMVARQAIRLFPNK